MSENLSSGTINSTQTNKQTNKGIRNFVTETSRNFRKFKGENGSQQYNIPTFIREGRNFHNLH